MKMLSPPIGMQIVSLMFIVTCIIGVYADDADEWSWSKLGNADKEFPACQMAERQMRVLGKLRQEDSLRPMIASHPDANEHDKHAMRCICPLGTMCSGKKCRTAIHRSFTRPSIHAFTLPVEDAACIPIPNYSAAEEVSERMRRAKINRFIYNNDFGSRDCSCDHEIVTDLEGWLERRNLSKMNLNGPLQVHGYWRGSLRNKSKDLRGLFDSFLSTNHHTAIYNFWVEGLTISREPILTEYASHPRIRLRNVNLSALAAGTCLQNRNDILTPKRGQFTQGYSDMIRLLILEKHGGIWADADSVFLRDLRPFLEVAGEFLSLMGSLANLFNNNAIGMRRGSINAHILLNLLCAMGPWPENRGDYIKKTSNIGGSITGMSMWYWNDGLLKSAVNHHHADFVRLPMSFFDPGWTCGGTVPWSGGFASETTSTELEKRLEVSRGAALLHTRATHPEFDNRVYSTTSYAGRLYAIAADRVKMNLSGIPLGKLGPRTREEQAKHREWTQAHHIADPTTRFVPQGRAIVLRTMNMQCVVWVHDRLFFGQGGQCTWSSFQSVWVFSSANVTAGGRTGHYIRTGSWRTNRCLRAFRGPGGTLKLHLDICWSPRFQNGQLWNHEHDGTVRSSVDNFRSCLSVSADRKREVIMAPCQSGRGLKFKQVEVPPNALSRLHRMDTEKEFPAAFQSNVN